MSINTFWKLVLKLLGLFLLLSLFSVLTQYTSYLTIFITDSYTTVSEILIACLIFIIVIAAYYFIIRALFFRPTWLIKIFRLDDGFTEERIDFNIKSSAILRIAVIILRGITFIQAFPSLCQYIFYVFRQKTIWKMDPDFQYIILYGARTIIGYLLLANNKRIALFLDTEAS